jgi:cobalt-zinc-cadmium efflux system membrane fusion protein
VKFPTYLPLLPLLLGSALSADKPARNEQTVVLDANGVQNLGIETVQAEETTFENTVFALGEVEHTCESHSVLSSRVPGRIIEVGIHEGEFAKEGEVLARVESRQPGDPPPVIELKAPADGLVIKSDVHLGAPVEADKELMEILDLSTVWIVAQVPQTEAAILTKGLEARIKVPAISNEEHAAKFLRMGTTADAAAGVIGAIFKLPNPGMKLRPGMRAEVALVSSKRESVLSIPRVALQGDRSNRFVFIRDYELPNAFVRVPVVVGATEADRVEISSGILPGDEVVTNGAYALAFAGKGSASLKEALDAAHGHPHKEDGTEMSAEEAAAAANGTGDGHDHDGSDRGPLTLFLAITCGVLFLLLLASPFVFRARAKA